MSTQCADGYNCTRGTKSHHHKPQAVGLACKENLVTFENWALNILYTLEYVRAIGKQVDAWEQLLLQQESHEEAEE